MYSKKKVEQRMESWGTPVLTRYSSGYRKTIPEIRKKVTFL